MNFNRILLISFIILVISTLQTDSGLIFALLLKVLLLKGALFLSMPLSMGAFMMGQGMGFFSGNMMGGYMMLRAANRYHNKEKVKWGSGGYGGGGGGGYGGGAGYGGNYGGWGGWDPSGNKYFKAYDKGKDIGSALHALTAHKNKLAQALYKVKGFLGHHPKGWGPPGWGSHGGYSHNHEQYHASHTHPSPVTSTKYKLYPYNSLKHAATPSAYGSAKNKGYGAPITSSVGGYSDSSHLGGGSDYGQNYDTGNDGQVLKGNLDYSNYYPASHGSSYGQESSQDPTNTFYTSAYEGPGHEYTGILTENKLASAYLSPAESKSSEEIYGQFDDMTASPTAPTGSIEQMTIAPNPLLEKYLEKRLEEEASKQNNNNVQKDEAKQLIAMLRKAYLKQLVESLKEEEVKTSQASQETSRDSRSIEGQRRSDNIIEQLLYKKFPTSDELALDNFMDMVESESVVEKSVHGKNSTEDDNQGEKTTPNSIFNQISKNDTTEATTTKPPISTSTENNNHISSTESSSTAPPSSTTSGDYMYVYEDEEGGNEATSESPVNQEETQMKFGNLRDFMKTPTMWIRAENTFSDESKPFGIRVRRNTARQDEDEEDADADEAQSQPQQNQAAQSGQSAADTEKQIKSFVDDIKKFFTLLTVLDQDQCLQKLVCDVHTNQKDPNTLTQYEQNILTTFRLMKALMPEGEEDSSTKYRRAALIGETGQSLELCQQSYATCGFSSSQIISLGSQAEATPSDWSGAATDAASSARRSEFVTMPRVRRGLRDFHNI